MPTEIIVFFSSRICFSCLFIQNLRMFGMFEKPESKAQHFTKVFPDTREIYDLHGFIAYHFVLHYVRNYYSPHQKYLERPSSLFNQQY